MMKKAHLILAALLLTTWHSLPVFSAAVEDGGDTMPPSFFARVPFIGHINDDGSPVITTQIKQELQSIINHIIDSQIYTPRHVTFEDTTGSSNNVTLILRIDSNGFLVNDNWLNIAAISTIPGLMIKNFKPSEGHTDLTEYLEKRAEAIPSLINKMEFLIHQITMRFLRFKETTPEAIKENIKDLSNCFAKEAFTISDRPTKLKCFYLLVQTLKFLDDKVDTQYIESFLAHLNEALEPDMLLELITESDLCSQNATLTEREEARISSYLHIFQKMKDRFLKVIINQCYRIITETKLHATLSKSETMKHSQCLATLFFLSGESYILELFLDYIEKNQAVIFVMINPTEIEAYSFLLATHMIHSITHSKKFNLEINRDLKIRLLALMPEMIRPTIKIMYMASQGITDEEIANYCRRI